MTRMVYIDEYAALDLDSCCKRFHIKGKNKDETIEKWYSDNIENIITAGKILGRDIKKTDKLWKHSLFLWENWQEFRDKMMEYNLQDCEITYNLYFAQENSLTRVYDAYMVDVKLTPLIIQMKRRGILMDNEKLDKLTEQVKGDIDAKEKILVDTYGIDLETISSSKKLGERLNKMGIYSPVLTPKGAQSWGVEAMDRLMHYPVIPLIQEVKGYKKLLDTYLYGGMANSILSTGRIHCTFSPNRRESGGTVTGRFSSSKPNLQQIPARDKQIGHSYGQEMRSLFLPEEGCMLSSLDYSQIEYLLLAHFAQGPQAEWFRQQALNGVDFHTVAMEATGIPSRSIVKTFNYGVIYGMGWRRAMTNNYVLFDEAAKEHDTDIETYVKQIYNDYHARLPVIRDTMSAVQNVTKIQGYIMTIGGRYQNKPKAQWDPATGKMNDYIYKMLNKLIQGSAADILKWAMLDTYESGILNELKMHLTVHDELVVSSPYNKIGTEATVELKRIMENSFHDQLKVPMRAACGVGPNWGYWNDDIWEDMKNGKFDRQKDTWWGRI
jgi:DNA polymerase-1